MGEEFTGIQLLLSALFTCPFDGWIWHKLRGSPSLSPNSSRVNTAAFIPLPPFVCFSLFTASHIMSLLREDGTIVVAIVPTTNWNGHEVGVIDFQALLGWTIKSYCAYYLCLLANWILFNIMLVLASFLCSFPFLHIKNKLLVEYLIGSRGSALVLSVLIPYEMRCSTCQQWLLMMSVHLAEHRLPWPADLNWVVRQGEHPAAVCGRTGRGASCCCVWEVGQITGVLPCSCWMWCRWHTRLSWAAPQPLRLRSPALSAASPKRYFWRSLSISGP